VIVQDVQDLPAAASLPVDGPIPNTAIGCSALVSNTTGHGNTATGFGALLSNTTGEGNTASGAGALSHNTTGTGNTAIGFQALHENTTGSSNTASGESALFSNTTGFANTASGANALGTNTGGSGNTASGVGALLSNIDGDGNTASGFGALSSNTGGGFNTASGALALAELGVGSNNIAIGDSAGATLTTGNLNIYVGSPGGGDESNTIRIGDATTHDRAFIAGISAAMVMGEPVMVNADGQLGTLVSSRRFKEDIQDMGEASSGVLRLRPVTFRYKGALAEGNRTLEYGLIAEEVAEVQPNLVVYSRTAEVETVLYHKLVPMLLNELQKQHRQLAELKTRLEALETLTRP
jgi:hypothetical protein